MRIFETLITLALASAASATCSAASEEAIFSQAAFAQADIAQFHSGDLDGDSLMHVFYPTSTISVKFGTIASNYGTAVGSDQTKNPPHVVLAKEPCPEYAQSKYLMMLVDADAPDPSVHREASSTLLWLVYDIVPGVDVLSQLSSKSAKVLATYQHPTFNDSSIAYHRFVFLVLRQPKNFVPPSDSHYKGNRTDFYPEGYIENANLYTSMVAGNYFRERTSSCDGGLCNWTGIAP